MATQDYCHDYTSLELDSWEYRRPGEITEISRGCLAENEFDSRYQTVSDDYSVSRLQVQDRSGVYDLLDSQPQSDDYFTGAERANQFY